MKTYRIYGSYVQPVYVDIVAVDAEDASDQACDLKLNQWVQDQSREPKEIDQLEIEFQGSI